MTLTTEDIRQLTEDVRELRNFRPDDEIDYHLKLIWKQVILPDLNLLRESLTESEWQASKLDENFVHRNETGYDEWMVIDESPRFPHRLDDENYAGVFMAFAECVEVVKRLYRRQHQSATMR